MRFILVAILLFIGVVESIRRSKLTVAGAIAGGLIGFSLFIGAGWTGIALLAAFFLLGTLATSWQRKQKAMTGMAQEKSGKRKLGQVLANGGIAGIAGLLTLFFPEQKESAVLMMAGAFSAALADTLSSELGTIYGKKFYNIANFQKDKKGLDGVISLEGTVIGILGSGLIALIYSLGFGWNLAFLWIIIAGTVGNFADSLLGATAERRGYISNDAVNFTNTVIGALVAWLLFSFFS